MARGASVQRARTAIRYGGIDSFNRMVRGKIMREVLSSLSRQRGLVPYRVMATGVVLPHTPNLPYTMVPKGLGAQNIIGLGASNIVETVAPKGLSDKKIYKNNGSRRFGHQTQYKTSDPKGFRAKNNLETLVPKGLDGNKI